MAEASISLGTILSAVGTAASIGTSIYGATQSGATPYVAPIIKPTPIDPAAANATAGKIVGGNIDYSNAQQEQQYPGLVLGRNAAIADTTKQLTGPLDPTIGAAFTRQGVEGALGATGSGNVGAGIDGTGSATQNEVSRSIATNVLQKQDQDRNNLDVLLPENPEPGALFTGSQIAGLEEYTNQATNEYNFQNYQRQQQLAAANSGGGGF